MSGRRAVALVLAIAFGASACNSMEKAAREDPMKCERDPKCEKKRTKNFDCSSQCTDDPACMERCEQVQKGSAGGGLGH